MRQVLRDLKRLYDPLALCAAYKREGATVATCDHTFRQTRAVLARYAPRVDADAYIARLEAAGQHCDCEVMLNVCPETGA